ncbi:MAG: single-stranded-DNA-specific exonuclease RecJ [Bacteroidia bacterium]
MEKQWLRRNIPDEGLVQMLMDRIGISSVLASLMAQRNLTDFELAKKYFNPDQSQLHDPFVMKGMDKAINRIAKAIKQNEKILFYGDYDVDGTTSVALMVLFFRNVYSKTGYYIPDRHKEGYGVSSQGIDFAANNNFSLIIAMDCGIRAVEKVEYANDKGIDFIICDHHTPGEKLPEAIAVLDPKREDCPYPYKELSGCGIAFKLCCAMFSKGFKKNPFDFLDLVAVSIASDIVPITGENRVLAHFGLQKLNTEPIAGIEQLKKVAAYTKAYNIGDVVFKLGPRINAAGRLEHAKKAVALLVGNDIDEIEEIGKRINDLNISRRGLEHEIVTEAIAQVKADTLNHTSVSTVVYSDSWHKGVVGIVASKLVEEFYKPTVVLTKSNNGFAVGSARSIEGFNLYNALNECNFLFEKFGGHKAAAGLTIAIDKIEDFKTVFDDVVRSTITTDQLIPKQWFDSEIAISSINWSMYNTLERMGPFGPENMRPTFVSTNVKLFNTKIIGEKHIKFTITNATGSIDCIAFNFAHLYAPLHKHQVADICYTIETNEWKGNRTLQLNIKDLKPRLDEIKSRQPCKTIR